jgi:hypothetical protein
MMFQLLTFGISTVMKFITIGQYFYKLSNTILLVLLVPIFSFVAVYFLSTAAAGSSPSWATLINLSIAVAVDWIIMLLIFDKKIKSIRKDQGLRLKLEKYFRLTIVRYTMIAAASMLLAYAFYITHDDRLTALFALNLLMLGVLWPTSSKVCNDLKLRGDEREMVYYKKDYF